MERRGATVPLNLPLAFVIAIFVSACNEKKSESTIYHEEKKKHIRNCV